MEFERQSREQRLHANTGAGPSSISLAGPVGLRGRVSNVQNSSSDQEKVIALLASIPVKDGGKQGAWPVSPLPGPPGNCPKVLADAIWDFQSWWKTLGVFRNIDGVVDPGGNTLRHLNLLASRGGGGLKPGPGPIPPTPLGLRADTGEWWITGVDTFGLPIKAGVSAAKISVSLLNDLGETYTIGGYGGGIAVGADIEAEKYGKILGKLIEIGMKPGDIANIHKKLSVMSYYSKTAGAVLKRGSLKTGYTIDDLTKVRNISVTSAAASTHYGVEIGLVTFFPADWTSPIHSIKALWGIGNGQPWGAYASFSGGKLTAEVGFASYAITSVNKG